MNKAIVMKNHQAQGLLCSESDGGYLSILMAVVYPSFNTNFHNCLECFTEGVTIAPLLLPLGKTTGLTALGLATQLGNEELFPGKSCFCGSCTASGIHCFCLTPCCECRAQMTHFPCMYAVHVSQAAKAKMAWLISKYISSSECK